MVLKSLKILLLIIKVCKGFTIALSTTLTAFQGVAPKEIEKNYRGEVVYNAENETNFPYLTVGQTLKFAALARTPESRLPGVTRDQYATHIRDVAMTMFGLLHTMNTRVGDDFVRGVSGGERKRVSISEVVIAGTAVQAWDNATRGLDSATALGFVKSLKIGAELGGAAVLVSLYQASQDSYDLFDKVTVLYLGRQIYFGPASKARSFFENMGYVCISRQTTSDFLTSITSPSERVVKPGYENLVPRSPKEFEEYWLKSAEYQALIKEIDEWNAEHPIGGGGTNKFVAYKKTQKSKLSSKRSPYFISYPMQISICVTRGFQRLVGDPAMTLTSIFGNTIASLLVSSVFYNQSSYTSSFYGRGAALFFSVLFNTLSSVLEVFALYKLRPVVEKHSRYAFYHPSAEAFASFIVDMPGKIITSICFNVMLYFMVNLKREPGAFFIYFFFSFLSSITSSFMFRSIASVTKSVPQALTPAALLIFVLVVTAGFVIPVVDMRPWIRWINYINPMGYAFEAVMINEFRNKYFECSDIIPRGSEYENTPSEYKICNVASASPGQFSIFGNDYLVKKFKYNTGHLWRNLGILFGFCAFYFTLYIFFTEFVKGARSKGEILVFPREVIKKNKRSDIENQERGISGGYPNLETKTSVKLQRQEGIFQWENVCYDIKIKGEPRRILDHVDGWVKPGTLTALMGSSGAGKTTLLDTLADRITMGVVTGDMLVNGNSRDVSFQRKTGYVQQQDVHLNTTTVREALEFSALLRQPDHIPKQEKLAYVNEVIKILEMEEYANAIVGVPGEGLNVEQRKRLTIGVELAAKPQLLLFLDEPTSGLDSQTAWSIVALMKKLTKNGQAILCTIHQPSAVLFQQFDRLLFLKRGGQTVYYGDIGENSSTLTDYFVRNGAKPCPPEANPAEWMLEVIGAAPGSYSSIDWFDVWRKSSEFQAMKNELHDLREQSKMYLTSEDNHEVVQAYAIPIWKQCIIVSKRSLWNTWRNPQYILAKIALCVTVPFFLGINFWKAKNTLQGMQDQMFSVFMMTVLFQPLSQQIMTPFTLQRKLYETRERPSKTYSWVTFMTSMFAAEIPWQTMCGVVGFFTFYYPTGFYRNAEPTDQVHMRGALFFLILLFYYYYILTCSYMAVAALSEETASNICNIVFNIVLAMSGVLVAKNNLPGFWIFMYRCSPWTYTISGMLSAGIAHAPVKCADKELLIYATTPGLNMTCGEFLGPYASANGGSVYNPNSFTNCQYCTMTTTDDYLATIFSPLDQAWRNYGVLVSFVLINVIGAYFMYWLFRVPKSFGKKKE